MTFDFPNSPALGQAYTPVSGLTYVWDGTAWKGAGTGAAALATIGDVPPTNAKHGQLWWESDTGAMFVWFVDVDSSQWVQVSSAPPNAAETVIYDVLVGVPSVSVPDNVAAFRTNGYSVVGDGGGALYRRSVSEPAHAGKIQSLDGAWWELADAGGVLRAPDGSFWRIRVSDTGVLSTVAAGAP